MNPLLCYECFGDQGLRLDSARLGEDDTTACPHCGSVRGKKLDRERLEALAASFFVHGTLQRPKFGGYPGLQFNNHRYPEDSVAFPAWLVADTRLISDTLRIGIFEYGPRFWMFGEIKPLKDLRRRRNRQAVIDRIISEYPAHALKSEDSFFRLRINPKSPANPEQYDSPPEPRSSRSYGRLDSATLPILYGSQDLEVCVHECRTTVDDVAFVATLSPARDLRLLDLSAVLKEDVTEFESLDLSVTMLFLAGRHTYGISRTIASVAHERGFDGLVYPSYFTLARTGGVPFPTVYGLSVRRFPSQAEYIQATVIQNLALFGRPIVDGLVRVKCVNRLVLNRVVYDLQLGPGDFGSRD